MSTLDQKMPSGAKPTSGLGSGLAFAHRRLDILREVCIEVVEAVDIPPAQRAALLRRLAQAMVNYNG